MSRSIAVIMGSTREPRVCTQITSFVTNTIRSSFGQESAVPDPQFAVIDLKTWNLPFFDESTIPQQVMRADDYDHEYTRAWSREISRHDAFIFVTPQYNWGYPAALKNAIDYLYNEWKGKPAMVVSYGGHGGSNCNAQLRQVLKGLKMNVVDVPVELTFPSRDVLVKAATGKDLGLNHEAEQGTWSAEKTTIVQVYKDMVSKL